MIGQITPLVKVASKRVWFEAVAAHLVGLALSSVVLGLILGSVGSILGLRTGLLAAGVVAGGLFLVLAMLEANVIPYHAPSLRRQTPGRFNCAFGPVWAGLAWGLDLGQGWTTRIEFVGYYGLVFWSVLTGSPVQAALVTAAFGLGRGLPVALAGVVAHGVPSAPLNLGYFFHTSLIHRLDALALAVVGGFVLVAAIVH